MSGETEPRKKKKKRAYLNDYQLNSEGKYQYQGIRHYWSLDESKGKELILKLRFLGIIPIILGVICGCVPAPGMGHWVFIILPYIISLAAELSLCIAVFRMCHEGNPLRGHVYEKSVEKLPERSFFTWATSAIVIIAEIVYIASHGTEGMLLGTIVLIILEILTIVIAVMIRRITKPIKWTAY